MSACKDPLDHNQVATELKRQAIILSRPMDGLEKEEQEQDGDEGWGSINCSSLLGDFKGGKWPYLSKKKKNYSMWCCRSYFSLPKVREA